MRSSLDLILVLQICCALLIGATQGVHIGVVLSWATRSHVLPVLTGLRPLAPVHNVTFLCSDYSRDFARDQVDFVSVKNLHIPFDPALAQEIVDSLSQAEVPVDHLSVLVLAFRNIAELYEVSLLAYVAQFRAEPMDLVICDWLDRACMDAALETRTNYAISLSSFLGLYGIGDAWYVPDMLKPASVSEWIASPWTRFQALVASFPVVKFVLAEEWRLRGIRAQHGFDTSATIFDHLQSPLVLAHNMIGLDGARPLPPNLLVFGPMADDRALPHIESSLAQDLDNFAAANVDVVYIAFGSALSLEKSQTLYHKLVRSVETLLENDPNIAVVWASPYQDPAVRQRLERAFPERLRLPKWVSQKRVLGHSSVKVFVSHAGYGSLIESIHAAKPLVLLPFGTDAYLNAVNAIDAGVATQLDKYTFTSDDMTSHVQSMLTQSRNASSELMRNARRMQTIAQLNSATGAVAFPNMVLMAATAGAEHLVPRDVHLSAFQRFAPKLVGVERYVTAVAFVVVMLLWMAKSKNKKEKSD